MEAIAAWAQAVSDPELDVTVWPGNLAVRGALALGSGIANRH